VEPWLVYEGNEIANAVRTLSYLRNGLGGSMWSVGVSGSDLGDVSQLGCFCEEMNDGPYVDPASDDAPWYDAARPESQSFLGFFPTQLDLVPALARSVGGGGVLGSSLGRLVLGGTLVQASGWLIAATAAGQEYGERWLLAALRGQCLQEGCDVGELCLLPACPEGVGYESTAFRTLYRAGLIDYVPARPHTPGTETHLRVVSFQIRSELPWMFNDALPLVSGQSVELTSVSALASTDTWPGEAGVKIKIAAGTKDAGPFRVTGVPRKSASDACAPPSGIEGVAFVWNIDQNWRHQDPVVYEDGVFSIEPNDSLSHDLVRSLYVVDISGHHWYGTPTDAQTIGYANNPHTGPYLWIPDGNGGLSTPDSAGTSIISDIALEVVIEIENLSGGASLAGVYDLVSKWGAAGQRSYLLTWNVASKQLEFAHSADGTATVSTGTVPFDPYAQPTLGAFSDGRQLRPKLWIRADLDVVNGANHVKSFYLSFNGTDFALLGSTTTAGNTSIFNSTAATVFCNRAAGGGFFQGGFYSGRIGAGLWAGGPGFVADPDIAANASATSGTFSDGTNTWTIIRPSSGLKAAVVNRGLMVTGSATEQRGIVLEPNPTFPGLADRDVYPGQFASDESFTIIWYGKVWGTTTNQTLMGRRLSGAGAGWEIRRGASANRPEGVISDGTATIVVVSAGAVTAGLPFSVAMIRDVDADTVRMVVNGAYSGSASADTTTGDISSTGRLAVGGVGSSETARSMSSNSDQEFYACAVIHGRALTDVEVDAIVDKWALTGAAGAGSSQTTPCFDMTATVPAGTELTIDGATRSVELRRTGDRVLVGGLDVLDFSGPMTWPEMGPCADVCWSVDGADVGSSGAAVVTIEQINREV
jgi:hypothetical protein